MRGVGRHLRAPGPQRVHVLDGEHDVGFLVHPLQAGPEIPRVITLPAKRRMHHHHACVKLLRYLLGPDQLAPRLAPPYPLADEQARRMHRQHRDSVVVGQPTEHVDVLADRVG